MARRLSSRHFDEGEVAEPNLTPLIDVVFVVLIMFIVVAPILEIDRVRLAAGRHDNPDQIAAQEGSEIVLHVHADNTIWLNRRQIDPSRLEESLATLYDSHPGERPQLFHDSRALFGTYQQVKNAVESAGFEELDLILEPQ